MKKILLNGIKKSLKKTVKIYNKRVPAGTLI